MVLSLTEAQAVTVGKRVNIITYSAENTYNRWGELPSLWPAVTWDDIHLQRCCHYRVHYQVSVQHILSATLYVVHTRWSKHVNAEGFTSICFSTSDHFSLKSDFLFLAGEGGGGMRGRNWGKVRRGEVVGEGSRRE